MLPSKFEKIITPREGPRIHWADIRLGEKDSTFEDVELLGF